MQNKRKHACHVESTYELKIHVIKQVYTYCNLNMHLMQPISETLCKCNLFRKRCVNATYSENVV